MTSFVSGRTQQVSYNGQLSSIRPVQFGVPQRSVLGPLLFVLYTAVLNKVIASHGLRLHQYADDCQVCVTTSVDDAALAVDRLAGCVADVGAWTSSSRLRLNSSKTQVMWLGHKNQIDKINISNVPVLSSTVSIVDSTRDHGVVIDSRLTMSDQVTTFCPASYYQLRKLRPVARSLPKH